MFHMYVGVRAGGGIGDEIEDPAGDEFEVERIVFDITFFFFVIVILLAIIQGESHRLMYINMYTTCYYLDTYKIYSSESLSMSDTCHSDTSTSMHMYTGVPTDAYYHDLFSGLIIDAFGELRDQQEQVKEDMEVRFDTFSLLHY